jgi:hypothetical protein
MNKKINLEDKIKEITTKIYNTIKNVVVYVTKKQNIYEIYF